MLIHIRNGRVRNTKVGGFPDWEFIVLIGVLLSTWIILGWTRFYKIG